MVQTLSQKDAGINIRLRPVIHVYNFIRTLQRSLHLTLQTTLSEQNMIRKKP